MSCAQLLQTARTGNLPRLIARPVQRRQYHSRQQGNDGARDQQLKEGEIKARRRRICVLTPTPY